MNDEEVNSFISSYRDLDRQQADAMVNLYNNRRNAFTDIMSGANKAGMMYSNFPELSKMRYDTGTYYPAAIKIQQTYQTGLDKLRSGATNYVNTLASINEAIADLEESGKPNGSSTINDAGDYWYSMGEEDSQFRDVNGNSIRMGTALKRKGIISQEDILKYAQQYLGQNTYNQLKTIWDRQQNTKHPNFYYNVGKDFVQPNYSYLSPEDNALLGRLGLGFN